MLRRLVAPICKTTSRGFATYKSTTGLVGLNVDPNGRENLLKLSSQALQSVKKIPETAQYRINVEKWFNFIHKSATEHQEIRDIELAMDMGQIEEVIEMTKDELEVIDFYYENKVWEAVEETKRDNEALMEQIADTVYFFDPKNSTPKEVAA